LEVIEAIETLNGRGPEDFTALCVALATHMLVISDRGTEEECEAAVRRVMADGSALDTFAAMVRAQGGDPAWIYHPEKFPAAPYCREVKAPADGYITAVDCEGYGTAALLLGAGRNRKEDVIDPAAGMILHAKTGDAVAKGQSIATLYASRKELLDGAEAKLLASTVIGAEKPEARPLIIGVVE
jgi:pyrimidine-nucleoside phosphorylase